MTYQVYVLCDCRKPGPYTYGTMSFDFKPFYVGQTKHLSARMHQHYFSVTSPVGARMRKSIELTGDIKVETVWSAETVREICRKESEVIATIGRKDLDRGPLLNRHAGGQVVEFYSLSKGQKARYKRLNKSERRASVEHLFEGLAIYYEALGVEGRKARGQAIADKRKLNGSELARGKAISATKREDALGAYRKRLQAHSHFKVSTKDFLLRPNLQSVKHKCEVHGIFSVDLDKVSGFLSSGKNPCKFCNAETFTFNHALKLEALRRRSNHV